MHRVCQCLRVLVNVCVSYLPLFAIRDHIGPQDHHNHGSNSRTNHCKWHVHFPLIENTWRRRDQEGKREIGEKKWFKFADSRSGSSFSMHDCVMCVCVGVCFCMDETYRKRFGKWISLRNIIVAELCLVAVLEYGAIICIVCGPYSLFIRFVARMWIFQPWAIRIIVPFMINRFTNGIQHTIYVFKMQTNKWSTPPWPSVPNNIIS